MASTGDRHRGRAEDVAGRDDLTPEAAAVLLPGEAIVRPTAGETLDALSSDLVAQALTCVRSFGSFHLAVGGDRSLDALYMRLMSDPDARALPWDRTHLWLTHEHDAAGGGGAVFAGVRDYLVGHSGIPAAQVHAIDLSSASAAGAYESALRAELGARAHGRDRLDAAVMSLDADGAIGGRAIFGPTDTPRDRVCAGAGERAVALTREFLNASRLIAVLALGRAQSRAVAHAAARADEITLGPVAGELRWYLDAEAAGAEPDH